jgi:hypothetical protein
MSMRAAPDPVARAALAVVNARASGAARLRMLRDTPRPFLHMPTLNVPSRTAVESAARELLSAPVEAARIGSRIRASCRIGSPWAAPSGATW